MAYKRQLQIALDRLDQGLARVHSMVNEVKIEKHSILWKTI